MSQLTVFTAKKIHTMNPPLAAATAVAVRDGLIVEVGSLESLEPWLDQHSYEIDERFADKIMLPGFIDPHLHPSMAAILLPMHFITAMEWRLPWQRIAPVRGHDAFVARLKELHQATEDPSEPMFAWGYHQRWHGEMSRAIMNDVSAERPIIVWHRSFHELYANDAAMTWMQVDEAELERHPHVDVAGGHFFEMGLSVAMSRLNPHLLEPARFRAGLERVRQVVHFGGHTTIGDMAAGLFNLDTEWDALVDILEQETTPFRVQMIPRGVPRAAGADAVQQTLDFTNGLPARNTHRLRFYDHVKLFTDGAFFSELMQLLQPGYIDGHDGEWLCPPEVFEAAARAYWHEGYKIHVHCTGDLGVELALDTLAKLQWERPRFDHRFTIEHFGLSTPEQCRRIAELGALVSANAYYLYELSDIYARTSIGPERAHQMARLGTLKRHNVTTALHTDFTMAPALPLNSAWIAANRINAEGQVVAPEERLTLDQALAAITIDAAYILGLEHEIGSIRAGKKADFTILEADPYETPLEDLKDIPIWGTVFEGRPFEIAR